jgi:hypothetical protein
VARTVSDGGAQAHVELAFGDVDPEDVGGWHVGFGLRVDVRVGLWEQLGLRSSLYGNCPVTAKWRRSRYGSIWPSVGRPAQSPQEFEDSSAARICRTPAPQASSRRHRLPMTKPTYKRGCVEDQPQYFQRASSLSD